nr:hypothetical protein [uncultured bacterium]
MFSLVRATGWSRITKVTLILCTVLLCSCANRPVTSPHNLCQIFEDNPRWYKAAKSSASKWGGPVHLPMAIMYQESGFRRKAKPPMQYFLGFIPTGRASDAYGYSQALKSTWAEYQREAGSWFSDRDNFSNAYDFIQWYMHKTYTRNGVSKWDGYGQYLNYHEGQGGYSRGTHNAKQWLLNTAKRVDQRSKKFAAQLALCREELDRNSGWF